MKELTEIQKIIKHSFTGKDNETYDVSRFLWVIGMLVYLFVTIYAVMRGQDWRPLDFGAGFGGMMAGSGAAIGFKVKAEPGLKGDR